MINKTPRLFGHKIPVCILPIAGQL
jgi:hypothetical protein